MKKTGLFLFVCFAILWMADIASAQCNPARIGGCPSSQAQLLLANTMSWATGGYGLNYHGGYDNYGYGRRDWKSTLIRVAGRTISNVYESNQETQRIREISKSRVVYAQPASQGYGLSNNKPLPFANVGGETKVYDPDDQNISGPTQLEKWTIVNRTSNPTKPILIYFGGKPDRWLQPGESYEMVIPMGYMDFRADGFKAAVSKKNPFRLQDQRIPLEPEKEQGRNVISFNWPEIG
jgi:hypothetical protein